MVAADVPAISAGGAIIVHVAEKTKREAAVKKTHRKHDAHGRSDAVQKKRAKKQQQFVENMVSTNASGYKSFRMP